MFSPKNPGLHEEPTRIAGMRIAGMRIAGTLQAQERFKPQNIGLTETGGKQDLTEAPLPILLFERVASRQRVEVNPKILKIGRTGDSLSVLETVV